MDSSLISDTKSVLDNLSSMDSFVTRTDFEILRNSRTPKLEPFSVPVDVWIKENLPFLMAFTDFASKLDNALGVAANQVAYKEKRLDSRFFVYRPKKDLSCNMEMVIDPVIEEVFGNPVDETEGCLSWPNKTIMAKRYLKIKVSYTTIRGERVTGKMLDRYQSQVWQHEMDHLEGIEENFVTTLNPYKRETVKVGRNDPCPCGKKDSLGRPIKYKKCCL